MPEEVRNGKIVTFYSYKGGTGRTMALANTAWILAGAGMRVLMVDWDLESPGLHRFFHPFVDQAAVAETPGLIDLIRDYQWAAAEAKRAREQSSISERDRNLLLEAAQVRKYARLGQHIVPVSWRFPGDGVLHFMSSGSYNPNYSTVVGAFDWDEFYEQLQGGEFFDAMRQEMSVEYDYVLIDSRTGLSDVAEICTMHFPHILVVCFTLSDQGIDGAAQVAVHVGNRADAEVRVLPVPTRIDEGEKAKADAGRALARSRFAGLPRNMTEDERASYWGAVEVPYRPFYAYEETLAVFGDPPGQHRSLLSSFERLVGYLTEGRITAAPMLAESERERVLESFVRKRVQPAGDVVVVYVPEDRMWAEWIAELLEHTGARVWLHDADRDNPGPDEDTATAGKRTVLAVVSQAYLTSRQAVAVARRAMDPGSAQGRARLVPVHVADLRTSESLGGQPPVQLAGLAATAAAAAVIGALDLAVPPISERPLQRRYPGSAPAIWNVGPRNVNFTGRNRMLDQLREQLAAKNMSVVLPIALHGLGGVGKTQIALEYVHRFKADYDLIWWVDAEQPSLINRSLAELAGRLGVRVGESEAEAARDALERLRTGPPHSRWLLVFDNADDPADLRPYLPEGSGHTLITSRNQSWAQTAAPLQVDAFAREESVAHLTARLPQLSAADADVLAETLGDLPLAVEIASAWLSETGTPVADYVQSLEQQSTEVLSLSRPTDYPLTLEATWQISIDRLAKRSPAGLRLLEMCAHMAPTISLDLIYGQQTADSLVPLDASLRVPMMIGRVVQEINRLALARVDIQRNELQIHRLMQAYLRNRLDERQAADTMHVVHRILVAGKPQRGGTDEPRNWPVYALLWPHLGPSRAETCDEEAARELLIDWVRFQWRDGALDSALALARQLETTWSAALAGLTDQAPGDDAQSLLRRQYLYLQYHIACIYRTMGKYSRALELDEAVLAEQRAVLAQDDLHTLMTAGTLAADLRGLGQYAAALELDGQTYASLKELFGEDHERTLSLANNLAVSLRATGAYWQAHALDEDTLRRRLSVLGEQHPNSLNSAAAVGRNLRLLGEYEESVTALEAAYQGYSGTLVETAVERLRAGTSLALSLRRAGAISKAHEITEVISARYAAALIEESPDALDHRLNVAADQAATGDPDAAAATARAAMDVYRRQVGDDHPYTHLCRSNLSAYLLRAGRLGDAGDEAESAAAALARHLEPWHPLAQAAAQNLANCLARSGRVEMAEEVDRRVYQYSAESLGEAHPETLAIGLNLADDLALLGRTAESEALRNRLMPQLVDRLGGSHPVIAMLRSGHRADREMEPMPT